jgi:hypothetical protein
MSKIINHLCTYEGLKVGLLGAYFSFIGVHAYVAKSVFYPTTNEHKLPPDTAGKIITLFQS